MFITTNFYELILRTLNNKEDKFLAISLLANLYNDHDFLFYIFENNQDDIIFKSLFLLNYVIKSKIEGDDLSETIRMIETLMKNADFYALVKYICKHEGILNN